MSANRKHKLDTLVARLQLQYGPRAIRKAAPAPEFMACLSTTFPDLDTALGGGLLRGRITEIVGPATSGKVTLAAKTLSAAHAERDALVAWLDLPLTCDPDYLHRCGLDLDRLLVVRPHDAADALAITLHLVESNTLAALVFDGTTQLRQADPATVTGSLERLATLVTQTPTAVIFLTEPQAQVRTLAHVAAVRLALRREQWLTRGNDVRGYMGQVEILKHRQGKAGAVVPIRIVFNGTVHGIGL